MAAVIAHYPGWAWSPSESEQASIDGWIMRRGKTCEPVECKARFCDSFTFNVTWQRKWLVTEQKLLDLSTICRIQHIKGYGAVGLVHSNKALFMELCDAKGNLVHYDRELSTTKATINGGSVERINAYVDMRAALLFDCDFSTPMSEERYDRLMENPDEPLTKCELAEGYHFCNEWDGLLVDPTMNEWGDDKQICRCGYHRP